ncbi:telomere repeats-binding bouquet formation protein 1 isoform X2 [Anolis carolinensis]|uniref:telomere repeats-binding bouquet formation protein 1 isoform X2 n=1 Tax=Anolis carolinensis TaxID=28377 RepID=UPI002F2B6B88
MATGKQQKIQCEIKTDLNLLLECLKYQMDHPASQKEALLTIYSACQQNSNASDYFREIGGLLFIHGLAKSSVHSMVKEAALFTLGGLAETNVFSQQMLCTSGLFKDLHKVLTNKDSSVNLKRMSVYVLLVLVSNNKSGQTHVRESGCLDVLLHLFRTIISASQGNLLDQNISQYQLWSSVCSTLCACVNNPQNDDNQRTCSLVFPYAKDLLQSSIKPEIVRPICSFIGLTVANNSKIQCVFVSIGGLAVLDKLLVKLTHNSLENSSNTKLAVVVTKTLDACITDNPTIGISLPKYSIVPNLLTLLSNNFLDPGEQFSIILTLGHCTESCVEKLSLQLSEQPGKMDDDTGKLEIDMQRKKIILEDHWKGAREILHRIERLEKEEKKKRQINDGGSPQDIIPQTASNHLKASANKEQFNKSITSTKVEQLVNSVSAQLIAAKFVNPSSKNELLKLAKRNWTDASISQNECNNYHHSTNKIGTEYINKVHVRSKNAICESCKSAAQAREFLFEQPDFIITSKPQQGQNTEPQCLSITSQRTGPITENPSISVLRCSGCQTIGLSLNSRNFSKILQTCQYLCEKHRLILQTEMKYKRKLKGSIVFHRNTSLNYNENPQTKQNVSCKKQTVSAKYSFKDQDQNEKYTYLLEDENTEVPLSDISATAFKKVKRRTRKDFTSEEIIYLLDGVKKMGHHWNTILWAYPFQNGRTNVDLAKKYCKLQKNENQKICDSKRILSNN